MHPETPIVVIGAGIMGLSIAYNLARRGMRNIRVLEKSYLCAGASGRNGGGIRAQWSSEANIMLMRESIEICRNFAYEMGINIWFRQGGYLFVVRSEEKARALQSNVEIQNRCGLDTRLLSPSEAKKIVPELDCEGIVASSFNPKDGVVFPWPLVWGYSEGASRLGVSVQTFAEVVAIETQNGRVSQVISNQGRYPASIVINACGAHSPGIAKLLNIELPNHPHRHEICVTEPLKMFLGPLVSDLSNGLYFSQSMRGEIVGGISDPKAPNDLETGTSHRFLRLYSQALLRAVPILGSVKVLRQWSGSYDLSPDQNPIVGEVDEIEGFYQASGFMGHGFMMAPVMGQRIAEHIVGGKEDPLIDRWNLRRFREGRLLSEGMIIG